MNQLAALRHLSSRGDSSTRQTKLFLLLKTVSLTRVTLAVVVSCVVVQVALGANLVVLALAMFSCVAGLAGFRIAGAYRSAAWLAFFFALGNLIIALVAKTVFLQPLDSNLFAPLESFLALAAGSTMLLLALLISLTIPVGKPLFRAIKDARVLRSLSNTTFGLGALFWFLNRLYRDPEGSGFGGVAVFWNLVLMAVIARTAMLMEKSDGRRSIDTSLAMILVACVTMGLIDNSKTEVALPIVAYFATSLFYRRGATLRQIGAGTVGLVIMVAIVGPMIHAFRGLGIQDLPWQKRLSLIQLGVKDALSRRDLEPYRELASSQFAQGYYSYFGGGSGQILLGRYASVQQIDPVIASINTKGTVGGIVVWPAFERLVPSFINPDKPRDYESYVLLVHLGIIDPEGGKFPTVPLVAQGYAAYGLVGLLLIPFLTFVVFLLALKKLGWILYRNVFAIFFFCAFLIVYSNQGDLGQFSGQVLRDFPLLALVLWLLTRIHRARFKGYTSRSLSSMPQA